MSTTKTQLNSKPLTERQSAVLQAIRDFIDKNHYSPAMRDLMDALGISSPNGIECHLKQLETKGYIARTPNVSRSIRVL